MNDQQSRQQELMLKGAAWMTASNLISRLLGALYIIPWYGWMGQHAAEANGLFTMGYNIYAWFLLVSTAGLPVAISKQIAKYNTMGEESKAFALINRFLKLMLVLGIVFAAIMYIAAPLFASASGVGAELIPVMQSLAWAVLIFPVMSIIRGVFQGYNNMRPFAMSQIAEQVARVIWMLLATFLIMQMGNQDYVAAVTQSTFAAFIGMIASMALLIFALNHEGLLRPILAASGQELEGGTELVIETLKEAVPFIITGSAIQLFQIIDQMTFINVSRWFTDTSEKDLLVLFSYFSANPNKVSMILIAVASSIGGVGIPLLTENFVKKDFGASAKLVIDNLSLLMTFLIPATFGSLLLSQALYTFFYGQPQGSSLNLFVWAMSFTIILGLYTVLAPMIQALYENRLAMLYFVYGLGLKLVLQIPFIWLFGSYGPLLATGLALVFPCVLMYQTIHRITRLNHQRLMKRMLLITLMTVVMSVFTGLSQFLLSFVIAPTSRWGSLLHLLVVGAISVYVYAWMALKSHHLDRVMGPQAQRLRQLLRIS
ncbi:polysaccharide biosynthesis protein [Streptococcus sp. NLN76]|uniref:putative polysaccharide biosynthesis protein n=1 Tax=Streptococcus sp. NLN76 TaxID=2822800 RepID=UPI0018AC7145|nr:polysaccharide biosynthesis protein [Streptococcus sp. NLN76]MBF8970304.1 polysaccharide biosynthesis protein [Streptococcus sp. NLN76]